MFSTLIRLETKNLLRDKMTAAMIILPFVFGFIGRLMLEYDVIPIAYSAMFASIFVSLNGFLFGAMSGFSILDDRDDSVFTSISISPVSLKKYIWFKVLFACVLGVLGGIVTIYIMNLRIEFADAFLIAALGAMQTPVVAFLINSFATNKVEGFVSMKSAGILMILPVISWLFTDWKEWLFAFTPGFYPIKALQSLTMQSTHAPLMLSHYGYILIGFVWCGVLIYLFYSLFKKKNAL